MSCVDIIEAFINIIIAIATVYAAISATCTAAKSNEIAKQSFAIAKRAYVHSQSDKISVWLAPGKYGADIILRNGSEAPIYDVFVGGGISNKGDEYKITKGLATNKSSSSNGMNHSLGVIPPGTWKIKASLTLNGMHAIVGATVVFKDINGKTWVRDAAGDLFDRGTQEPFSVLELDKLGQLPYSQETYEAYDSNQ